ncbi:MAG: histidine phosphatase family protein [Cytophagales bacterium]|nr:histidine phosphatase family protein [Cytophagales bacterium]
MNQEPTRIIAIRHGETAWNVDTRIQGSLDIKLNQRGHAQAQAVAQALQHEPITAIYASDLWRAHDTAMALGEAVGVRTIPTEGLRERLFGKFEGKTFAEIGELWPSEAERWRRRDPDFCPEGGESLITFRARVLACVSHLVAPHAGQQIVVVSHGGVNDILYRAATGLDLQAPRTWSLGNAEINRLLWTPQGFSLVGWADTAHLASAPRDEVNNPR